MEAMDTTKKTIDEQIEEMGMLQFTDKEIARIVGMPLEELTKKYSDNIFRGRLLAEAEVRKSVLQEAKKGSTMAQKQFMDLNRRAKISRR